jgi:hypothetical protein
VSSNNSIICVAAGSTIQIVSRILAPPIADDEEQQQPLLLFSESIVTLGLSRPGIMIQPDETLFIDAARGVVPEHVAYRASSSKEIPHITLQPGETFTITIA